MRHEGIDRPDWRDSGHPPWCLRRPESGLGPRGLPVGLQRIGHPWGQAKLLACARATALATGGPLEPIDPVMKTVSPTSTRLSHSPAG